MKAEPIGYSEKRRDARITVNLIPTADHAMEWLRLMFRQKVGPEWVRAVGERASEEFLVHTGAEAVTLDGKV